MRALFTLLVSVLICAIAPSLAAEPQKRVALVIGNGAYRHTQPLTNPANDAEDLSKSLKRLDFEVVEGRDLSKRGMAETLARFARLAQDADAALVFYAGHGLQHRGENYLVPVDAKLEDEISLDFETTRLDDVVRALDRARGVRILILDACRNLVLPEGKTTLDVFSSRGLAKIGRRGMIVAYATQADDVAYDGTGRNSFFTGALLRTIEEPGVEISQLFRTVAARVSEQTKGKQTPELSLSWTGEFFFNRGETDRDVWQRLRNNPDRAALQDFVSRFPNSDFADAARAQLELLRYRDQAEADRRIAEEAARRGAQTEQQQQLAREAEQRREAITEREQKAQSERVAKAREEEQRRKTAEELSARLKAEKERLAWERLEQEQRRRAEEQLARQKGEQERLARAREEESRQQAERERLAWARLEAEQRRRAEEVARREQDRIAVARTEASEKQGIAEATPSGGVNTSSPPDAPIAVASRQAEAAFGTQPSTADEQAVARARSQDGLPIAPAPAVVGAPSTRVPSSHPGDMPQLALASPGGAQGDAPEQSEFVNTGSISSEKATGAASKSSSSASEKSDGRTQIASLDLPPALPKSTEQTLASPSSEVSRAAQERLRELGCYPGELEARWGLRSTTALRNFYRHAGLAPAGGSATRGVILEAPDGATLDLLRSREGRICPLVCPPGRSARGDVCVVRTCPDGYSLDDDECVARPASPRSRTKVTRQREPQIEIENPRPRVKPRTEVAQPTPSLRRTKAANAHSQAPAAAPTPSFGPAHIGATRLLNRF